MHVDRIVFRLHFDAVHMSHSQFDSTSNDPERSCLLTFVYIINVKQLGLTQFFSSICLISSNFKMDKWMDELFMNVAVVELMCIDLILTA